MDEELDEAADWVRNSDWPDSAKRKALSGLSAVKVRHARLVDQAFWHPANRLTKDQIEAMPVPILERMLNWVGIEELF